MKFTRSVILLGAALLAAAAQGQTPFIGMGDSIGEGVQSANAFQASQQATYLNIIAKHMKVPFALPLMSTSLTAFIEDVSGRQRLDLTVLPADLAVSGATVGDLLHATANPVPATEADLVLAPYYGLSQLQIVEQVKPQFVAAWIGTDDLIGQVLDWTNLNNASYTPLPTFTSEYQEFLSRLKATGAKAVLGTIPDLTQIAFLFNNDDLLAFTGINYNLPTGYVTTLPTMFLLKLGVFNASILQNPAYVLTPTQLTALSQQINVYNGVIKSTAAQYGFPVADAHALFNQLIAHPININGVTVLNHYGQGAFSLDGVHPSNSGHAVFANLFIQTANYAYGMNIPAMSGLEFLSIFYNDPFIDFGGKRVVHGRPFTGLLDTIGPLIGLSGGPKFGATVPPASAFSQTLAADGFMRRYFDAKGQNPNSKWAQSDIIRAVDEMFGLTKYTSR